MKKNGVGLGLSLIVVLLGITILISNFFKLNEMNTALILGIVVGNLFLRDKAYKFYPGFDFANKRALPIAITCLGVKINYLILFKLGVGVIGFIIIMVGMLFITARYVAKLIGEKEEFGMVIGSGGVASIVGASEVLEISEEEFAMAMIVMNVLGLSAMLIMPYISNFLHFNTTQSALYIGGTLSSFIHIIPAAYSVSPDSLGLALLVKTGKLLFFPLILLYLTKVKKKKNTGKIKTGLPNFIKGFMVVGLIFTLLHYGDAKINLKWYTLGLEYLDNIFNFVFKYLLIFALIGIGGKINIRALLSKGKTVLIYSWVLMIVQLALGAGIVKMFY